MDSLRGFGKKVSYGVLATFLGLHSGGALCQKLPDVTVAPKGQTINLSLQTGSKSNLSFGSNTSFGASLSSQFSPGMTVTATSNFVPTTASIISNVGNGTTLGKTSAAISNLRAAGNGPTTVAGAPINANDATFASGNALLDGVSATVDISLNGLKSGFTVQALPNIVGGGACSASETQSCQYSDAEGLKPYEVQQFANGSSTAQITTNTNVDIGTSQYTSSFAQSF